MRIERSQTGKGSGTARVEPDADVVASSHGAWTISFVVGREGIVTRGGLRLFVPDGFSRPQLDDPSSPGYVQVFCARADVKLATSVSYPSLGKHFYPQTVYLRVEQGSLASGDEVEIHYQGQAQYFCNVIELTLAVDESGTGEYQLIASSPRLRIVPGPVARLFAIGPSLTTVGEPFGVVAVVRDEHDNVCTDFTGPVELRSDDQQLYHTLGADDQGHRRFQPLTANSVGVQRLAVSAGGLCAMSNPIQVVEEPPDYRLYWGDIHTMTGITCAEYSRELDVRGILDYAYDYARDACGLDIAAITDLDYLTSDEEWQEIRAAASRHYEPGRFVTFSAYEYPERVHGGDRNVYYMTDDQPIFGSRTPEFDTPAKLWDALRGRSAITIPHHPASLASGAHWEAHSPEMEPLVEIYSCWGSSEGPRCARPIVFPSDYERGSVQSALARGLRLGIIASSDSHTGQPGRCTWLRMKKGYLGGLMAVYAKGLDRESIFEAMCARRVYGTTGHRTILGFELNGHMMGEEFQFDPAGPPREIEVRVIGEAPIAEITVIRNNVTIHTHAGSSAMERVSYVDTEPLRKVPLIVDPAGQRLVFYYVRVTQTDGEIAWSSPIWLLIGKEE